MKKKTSLLAVAALLITCFAFSITVFPILAQENNPLIQKIIKSIQNQPGDSDVIAIVNGIPVTRGVVRQTELSVDEFKPGLSEQDRFKESFKIVARITVEESEAKRRGIEVTREEAQAFTDQMRKNSALVDSDGKAVLAEMIKCSGLSEEDFWKKQVDAYAVFLAVGKLRQQVMTEIAPAPDAVATTPENDPEKYYQSLIDSFFSKAKIEYKDKTLQ